MKLNFLSTPIKHAVIAIIVGGLFVLGGCSDDDAPAVPEATETIIQIVNGDPNLSDLAAYLVEFPDLAALLGAPGETTLFAPNNEAFTNLYAIPGFPEDPSDISLDLIKGVVAYHILASKLLAADITPTGAGSGIATIYNDTDPCSEDEINQVIKVNDDGTLLTGSNTTNIEILESDILATNGVVHITKSVLIPPSIGAPLKDILGTLAATVLLGADFTHLAAAVIKADCGVINGTVPAPPGSSSFPLIQEILADPSGSEYTAFLPPNSVFEGTAAKQSITVEQLLGAYTAGEWRDILLNHIVSGTKTKTDLTDGTSFSTLTDPGVSLLTFSDGTPGDPTTDPTKSPVGKYITTNGGSTGINGGAGATNAPIYIADVPANNGVAHVVGQILFPK